MWERELLAGVSPSTLPDGPWVEQVGAGLPAEKGPICCWKGQRLWIHDWNWQARLAAALHKTQVRLLVGGPGTGKSTRAAHLVEQAQQVTVTAPTGKAVSRLQGLIQKEGVRFCTLHRLLGARLDGSLSRPYGCVTEDLVVVDECSMIDGPMMAALVASLGPQTQLLLVGDPDQLPPIGIGSPFQEMARSHLLPCERLEKVYRTDSAELQALATAVREGRPIPTEPLPPPGDWICQLWRDGFQILTAMRQGPFGAETINGLFHERSMPICIVRNAPDQELYNGDIGRIEAGVAFMDSGPILPAAQLPTYTPAYALSIHRAQGSEWDRTAILLPPGSDTFGRELLYTAITRARREVRLFAAPGVVESMVSQRDQRASTLCDQIAALR
jgi:exodeoxyribonuclease V alpha subunit